LTYNESRQVSMNQTTLHRIDLPIVKHHFAHAHALDIDREDRISSGFRAQDRSQFSKRSDGSNSFPVTTINREGHHAFAPRTPRIVLAATVAQLCLHLVFFFLRHDSPPTQTFSDPGCHHLVAQVADGLHSSHQVFALR